MRGTEAILASQARLALMPQQLAQAREAAVARREADARAAAAKREADAAPAEAKPAAQRSADRAQQDAAEAAEKFDAAAKPVLPQSAEAVVAALEPFAPEATAARDLVSAKLVPALKAMAQATKSGDDASADRAANDARQAIDAAQRELSRAQDAFADRDPLVAARWFAKAAADALSHKPPEFAAAERHQRTTAAALSRSRDLSLRKAVAQRLALLPGLRPVLSPPAPADARPAEGHGPAPFGAYGATAREWRRLRPRESEDAAAPLRESAPPEYGEALDLYFKALNKVRDGGK